MSEVQTAPNLKVLDDGYEILGELRSGDRVGTYIAKRRADGADVIITVVQEPQGGENNALNHFAADTQLLSKISHPRIPQVIEGRWVGKDQFAVVSQRYQAETLDERLARGERFTPPRIAAVLREVDSVLEWARNNGIVHRGITPDTLSFETGTNRVLVVLEPTPIPIEGVPDAGADARTIGTLAWAMLTGERYAEGRSLAELRPSLSRRVIDDTEAMVRSTSGETRDVQTYISVVAAADALRAGEMEIAEMQAELLEARRTELEQFRAEQEESARKNAELQEQIENQRKEFERKMADEEAQLAAVKADFADLKSKEEGQLAAERRQFEQEQEQLARERAEFEQRVTEREADLAAKHADVDRIRAEEGQRIDAAIAAAVQTVAATAITPPPVEPFEPLDVGGGGEEWKQGARKKDGVPTPAGRKTPEAWIDETVRKHSVGTGQPAVPDIASTGRRPRWLIPASVAALIVVLVAIAAAANHHGAAPAELHIGKSTVVPTPPPAAEVRGTPHGGFLTQSAGGTVAQPAGPPTSPIVAGASATPAPTDSAAPVAAQRAGAASPTAATQHPVSASKPKPDVRRSTAADVPAQGSAFSAEAEAIRRAEAARRDSIARARRDSAPAARSDTIVRRDTVVPPPDTLNLAA